MTKPENQSETTLRIREMHCDGCVRRVKKALEKLHGVGSVKVDLEKEEATVTRQPHSATLDELTKAVEDAGFSAEAM